MNHNEKVIESISKSVHDTVNQLSAQIGYNRTVPARILSDLGNGKYMVSMQGGEYTVPCGIDMSFSVNDSVWVTIPCNQFNDHFISGKRV